MFFPLARIRSSRADDANILAAFRVRDNQNSSANGLSDDHKAFFTLLVIRIGNRDRFPVRENRQRLVEADAVLPKIS